MLTVAAPAHADDPAGAVPGPLQAAEIAAAAQARSTGTPVPVDAATDAYSTLTAQPDGTFTQDVSASPERVNENGTWVALDPTLHRNADGTYSTAATTAKLTLSGGGTAPLAAMDDAGKRLAFTWPTALPEPTVGGTTALYPDVLPDVDLSVEVNNQGGFTDTIIVKTAEAADNPALATLSLGTAGSEVALSADSAGNLSATDSAGTLIYHAPAPLMWDSTTTTAPAATKAAAQPKAADTPVSDAPGPGAQVAPVGVHVSAGSMQLTPARSLLTGDTTTYPVYIDPSYTPVWVPGSQTTGDYTYIQSGHSDAQNWQSNASYDKDGIGVGDQGYQSPTGTERSIYQWQLGTGIDAKTIHSATLNVNETFTASWGCETHSIRAYSVATHIGPGTTWDNYHNTGGALMDTQSIGGAYNTGCAGPFHSAFDVTSALAGDTDGMITIELTGDEANRDSFKRFAKTATLSYTYNTIPAVPTGPATQPAPQTAPGTTRQGCDSNGSYGWIPNGGSGGYVTLTGKISDPADSSHGQLVRGQFGLWDDSANGTDIISIGYPAGGSTGTLDSNADTGWQTSGSTATRRIPVGKLTNGHLYGWEMRTDDGINYSGNTTVCHFRYDSTAPTAVSINGAGTTTGSCTDGGTLNPAGTPDTFTLAATDTGSGLDHFAWTLGAASDLADNGGTPLTPGHSLSITPKSWGSYFLNVAALDKAGNQSGAVCYTFYVPDSPTAHVTPGDIDGDQYRDFAAITDPDHTSLLPGLRYYPTNISNIPSRVASDNTNGPNPDGTWTGALIAHRSTLAHSASGTKTDDLWALGTDNQLYLYGNTVNLPEGPAGYANQYYSKNRRATVPRPTCDTAVTTCTQYTTTWADVQQIIAPGDLNGDGNPDLITEETGNLLWFFPGKTTSGRFDSPQRIGNGGWDGYTLIAPGNTPADNGIAPLWARNKASGAIYQYTTTFDPATGKVTLPPQAQIGTGYNATDYPLIFSVGDISGDDIPDLVATTGAATLVDQLGTTTPSATEFDGTPGKPAQIGNSSWNIIATIN